MDSMQDTVLTVNADGTIGADFTGHVHAQGLDLDANPSAAEAGTTQAASEVRWLRKADGSLVAELYGGSEDATETGYLTLRSHARANNAGDYSAVLLQAHDSVLNNSVELELLNFAQGGGGPTKRRAVVRLEDETEVQRTVNLLKSDLASDFLRSAAWRTSVGLTGGEVGVADLATVPGVRARLAAAQNMPNAAWTTITFDGESVDPDSMHDLAVNPSRLTINTAGRYVIFGRLATASVAAGVFATRFVTNNVDIRAAQAQANPALAALGTWGIETWDFLALAVGDFVELQSWQNTGAAVAHATGVPGTVLAAVRVSS